MADAQACSLNKNTTQYGGHFVFCFSVRYVRLSVGASIFRILFCLYRFFFSISISGLPWRVFSLSLPLDFFSYHFQCVARRRRRRHHAPPPPTSLASPPLTQFYASALLDALFSVYLHFESVCGKNPKRKCRQKAVDGTAAALSSSRRVVSIRCVANHA